MTRINQYKITDSSGKVLETFSTEGVRCFGVEIKFYESDFECYKAALERYLELKEKDPDVKLEGRSKTPWIRINV